MEHGNNNTSAVNLSIVIPTLNESHYIKKTLDTVISNTFCEDIPEIIVVVLLITH